MDGDYVSVNQAAEIKGVTRQRILQYITDGRLAAQKFADVYMISRKDLDRVALKPPGRPPKVKPVPASNNSRKRGDKR